MNVLQIGAHTVVDGLGFEGQNSYHIQRQEPNILAVHYSGGLQTPLTQAFAANFGGVSQPVFFEGSTDIGCKFF